jgi:hypothetical protein
MLPQKEMLVFVPLLFSKYSGNKIATTHHRATTTTNATKQQTCDETFQLFLLFHCLLTLRYPGTTFIDHVLRFNDHPDVKILVLLGEVCDA